MGDFQLRRLGNLRMHCSDCAPYSPHLSPSLAAVNYVIDKCLGLKLPVQRQFGIDRSFGRRVLGAIDEAIH